MGIALGSGGFTMFSEEPNLIKDTYKR